jgi:hypothetical protein
MREDFLRHKFGYVPRTLFWSSYEHEYLEYAKQQATEHDYKETVNDDEIEPDHDEKKGGRK